MGKLYIYQLCTFEQPIPDIYSRYFILFYYISKSRKIDVDCYKIWEKCYSHEKK